MFSGYPVEEIIEPRGGLNMDARSALRPPTAPVRERPPYPAHQS
jgi:hypothetical protein